LVAVRKIRGKKKLHLVTKRKNRGEWDCSGEIERKGEDETEEEKRVGVKL